MEERLFSGFSNAEGLSDGRKDQGRVLNRGQGHKDRAILELVRETRGDPKGQAGLA